MAAELLVDVENIERRGAIDLRTGATDLRTGAIDLRTGATDLRVAAIDWRTGATLILDCLMALMTLVAVELISCFY